MSPIIVPPEDFEILASGKDLIVEFKLAPKEPWPRKLETVLIYPDDPTSRSLLAVLTEHPVQNKNGLFGFVRWLRRDE